MPIALDKGDRRLLIVTGFILVAFAFSIVSLAPNSSEGGNGSSFPSSYDAKPGDALAAYQLLERMHHNVQHWDRSPNELPSPCENCVLVLADPLGAPDPDEKQTLRNFVEEGGIVLFTGDRLLAFFDAGLAALEPQPPDATVQKYNANLPSIFSRDAPLISVQPEGLWPQSASPAIPLYGDMDSPVIVVRPIGRGRIIWWAGPTPLTNAGIRNDQNMMLFLDDVTTTFPGSDAPLQIFWDEYYHGERNSLWDYVAETPLPWGLLQLALLGLVVFLSFGRRGGPVLNPPKPSRLAPLEFVDTVGGLYERAKATSAAVGVVYLQLRGVLIRQLRLSADVPDSILGAEAEQRIGHAAAGRSFGQSGLADLLRRAAMASGGSSATHHPDPLSPREALELVRELEEAQQRLGPKSNFAEQRG